MSKGLRTVFVLYPLLIPALVCWIWLMILGLTLHHRCPKRCWCSPDGRNVECSDQGLDYIPENMLGELEKLKLDGNNYSVLKKDIFLNKGYTHIELLYFDQCNVSFIEVGAFDHISVETQLTLRKNNLTDILPGIFRNLTTLEGLHMANNKIEVIRSKAFKGLKSLTWISLQKNSIRYFETDAFWGLINLQSLWLSSNKLTHLQPEVFSQIPKLVFINLNWNMIIIPSHTEFLNSDTVERIELESCNISELHENIFRNMTNLETIVLQNNSLTYVNPNTFSMLPNLYAVYLYDNPLVCDCNLKATHSWFIEHHIQTGIRDKVPRCNAPIQLNGLWWGVLANGECHQEVMKFHKDVKSIVHEYIPQGMYDNDTYRHFFNFNKYVRVIIDAVLFLFGTVGNVTLIIIILRHKELRTFPNMYIFSLAIGDLTSLTLNGPLTYMKSYSHSWDLGEFMCRFFTYLRRLSIGVSCYSVVILSVQRYQVIARPILSRIRNNMSRKTVALHISCVWVLASLFAIPSCISAHVDLNSWCTMVDSTIYYQKVVIFELVVECVMPLCIIAAMYILTASHLMRSQVIASEEIHQHQANAQTTTVKTILSLTLVFVISFVPYHTMWAYFTWNEYESEVALFYLGSISSCLLFVNACFNPVALYYSSKSFRTHFKSFLLCCCKKQSNQSEESTNGTQVTSSTL